MRNGIIAECGIFCGQIAESSGEAWGFSRGFLYRREGGGVLLLGNFFDGVLC